MIRFNTSRKKLASFLFVALLLTAFGVLYSFRPGWNPYLKYFPEDGYEKYWKKVDSLESKGLTKTANEEVITIYDMARKDKNTPQVVKSMLYLMKYRNVLEEEPFRKNFEQINEEIKNANEPLRQILYSIRGQMLWTYYSQNRYKFSKRSVVTDMDQENVLTWDLNKIIREMIDSYVKSLKNPKVLKSIPLDKVEDILSVQPTTRYLRPTLYDFLSHRALSVFMGSEPDITKPAITFTLDKAEYFNSGFEFSTMNIKTPDSLATKFYAVTVLQDLLAFHVNDRNKGAYVDVDIQRLKFIKSYSTVPEKDSLYEAALLRLKDQTASDSSYAMVCYELAQHYVNQSSKWNAKSPDNTHKNDVQKAIAFCEEGIGKFPKSYGGLLCQNLKETLRSPYLQLNLEYANPHDEAFKVKISYKNTKQVYVKIVALDYDENYKTINNQGYSYEEMIAYLLKKEEVRKGNTALIPSDDYRSHDTELPVMPMDYGYYYMLVADNAEFDIDKGYVAYTDFWVTDIAPLIRSSENYTENEVFVLDRTESDPIAKATVNLYRQQYNYATRKYEMKKVSTLYTNKDGYAKVPYFSNDNYSNHQVEVIKGKDRFVSPNGFYQYKKYPQEKTYKTTHFFIDRGIYRPGQTIHFKGIKTRTDGNGTEIIPNYSSTVELYDANYQKKAELDVKTNEYGSFSGSFTIPQGEMTGQWYIQDPHGSSYFSVEEYKRPKFEVNFDTLKGNYRLNNEVHVKGFAKTFSGYAVDGAQVSYTVKRTVMFPYWRSLYYGYYWDYYNTGEHILLNGTTTTDENGFFDIDFEALPDLSVDRKGDPYFSYVVTVDVTDITGETRSSSTSVYAGYKSMMIHVDLPDKLNLADTNKYSVRTTNLGGIETPASGNLKISKLNDYPRLMRNRSWEMPDQHVLDKTNYVKLFPHDIYTDEKQLDKLKKEKEILSLSFDTHQKTQLRPSDLKSLSPGRYLVEATSTDPYGEKVTFEKYLTVYAVGNGKMPVNEYEWFIPVKTYAEPGEKAQFIIGSAAKNVKVLYEIEHNKKIVHKEMLTITNEQKLIEIPVKEEHRGNFSVHFTYVKDNRSYTKSSTVTVPFSNRQLDLKFITFRNKLLPGQKEEWKIGVTGPDKEKVAAEMLVTMYDASLDEFRGNYWYMDVNKYNYQTKFWQSGSISTLRNGYGYTSKSYVNTSVRYRYYEALQLFGFNLINPYGYRNITSYDPYYTYGWDTDEIMLEATEEERTVDRFSGEDDNRRKNENKLSLNQQTVTLSTGNVIDSPTPLQDGKDVTNSRDGDGSFMNGLDGNGPKIRSNFAETAFFFPHLETDENGQFVFSFTIPESLTKWKFMGLSHTKDLKIGQIQETVVTQKDLMITAFAPRFLRENDKLVFTAKVTNLSDRDLKGEAELKLFDALTGTSVNSKMNNSNPKISIDVKKGLSKKVQWSISIPSGIEAVKYQIIATAGDHSDGEEMILPVLLNSMLVTESMPLPINGNTTKEFSFEKLKKSGVSNTLRHHKVTLEFTSNPAWYAIQALPYMMEYPYECSEQTFNRLYANSIATHIANSDPRIKEVFETWKNYQPNALLSNLEKNQELKSVLLQETPWVMDAKNETERKRRIAVLFDLNRMKNELARSVRKLNQMQTPNGGWSWFDEGPDNRYITQYIVSGFGHLRKIGITSDNAVVTQMLKKGIQYLDNRIREDYEWLLKYNADLDKKHISNFQIQYLYARSFFTEIQVNKKNKKAFDYYLNQSKKYWLDESFYMRGMIALANFRYKDEALAKEIVKSLKDNALESEEMGMYWKLSYGWYWYQAPIETQALFIEAFDEITPQDEESVEKMKIWLLKNKQTNDWKTTKATAEACYALLLEGTSQLTDNAYVMIQLGNMTIDPANDNNLKKEAGTGYFKTSWSGSDIKPDMGNVTVTKKSKGVAWGAVYWQYFEQLDKITPASTPVKINKKLFREKKTDRGPVIEPLDGNTKLNIGDRVKVRVEIFVDRDMEFVHLKDMRASAFEPENVFSGYRHQDGLWYYEATKDAATHFFIDFLPKGTYVFEYPVRVTHEGDFSNGITELQCMYAPEFNSHSEGVRVKVGD